MKTKNTKNVESGINELFANQASRYFNKDVIAKAEDMTDLEMFNLIRDLESTRSWVAIVKYIQERLILALHTLTSLDPIKEPSQLIRYQGIILGMLDLNELIMSLKEKDKTEALKKEGKDDVKPY